MNKSVEIYKTSDGKVEIQVEFDHDTVWLSQNQMASLFDQTKQNISLHINNCFKEKELEQEATVKESLTVQKEGKRNVERKIKYYNLDVVISVGYRVKSIRGTQFRQWATQRLKDYLVKGYAINEKRIQENKREFVKTLETLKRLTTDNEIVASQDVLSLIQDFSDTWFSLEQFDNQKFPKRGTQIEIELSGKELHNGLKRLKKELIYKGEATELFGQEKREGVLEGIFATVFQTVFGEDAYPSIEEKAAHLLYFIVKNHPFNDGNKRSGAFSFIWLLQKAEMDFGKQISAQTLTTLTILIAESKPEEKDKMVGLIKLLLKS
ncbi:MAG TPA: virulence protein RhuM/Fic/DOC family protein [Flavobacteriaceae bacterium]|nr:virulence protein RhuM/Fic/DOC family protein [Flavobacteriaceae bacterium]